MRVLLVAIVLFAFVTTIAAQFNLGNAFGTAAGFLGGSLIGSSLRQGLGLGPGLFNGGGFFNGGGGGIFNGGGGFFNGGGGGLFNGGGGFFNGGGNNFDLQRVNLIVPNGGFNGFNGGGNFF